MQDHVCSGQREPPSNMLAALDASLRSLHTDYVDL
jgi:hypothetical protein